MWSIVNGFSPPNDKRVCHICDNPPCVNPGHLVLRDQYWNVRDRVLKGRCARGERIGSAKLTEKQVHIIKTRLKKGDSKELLAKEFGVTASHIYIIGVGQIWGYVEPLGRVIPRRKNQIDWVLAERFRCLVESCDISYSEAARRLGINVSTANSFMRIDRPKHRPPLNEETIENIRAARAKYGIDMVADRLGLSKFIVLRL
jgi:DNA invertase Pin-like site-specific DNA recombinase